MNAPPLIILAFDGADPEFLLQWAREGYLPTFASILQRGCVATTAGPELVSEHGIWVSMLSGISHADHGYYAYRQLKPGTYDLQSTSPRDAKATPFWGELRGQETRVAILDAPDILPIPGLQGMQLANWATHQAANAWLGPSSEPAALVDRVRKIFGKQMPVLEFKTDSTPEEDRAEFRLLLRRIEKKGALLRELLARDPYDLTVIGLFEAHAAGHRFWKYRAESPLSRQYPQARDLGHAIRDVYQAVDRQMGLLLKHIAAAGGAEPNVIITSAFSMEDYYPTTELTESFCRELGYQVAPKADDKPTASRSFSPMNLLRRAMPQSLRLAISQRLPFKMQEKLLAENFRNSTDWDRTTAFSIPGLYTGFIRVNLKGREPRGIVEPNEYESLLDKIEDDLRKLIDPVDGQPAVKTVSRISGTMHKGPPEMLPDLFVEWRPADYFLERVIHPLAELFQRIKLRYHRDSYHTYEGIIAAAGPSIGARGAIGEVSLLDVAPTLLALMGKPTPATLSGRDFVARVSGATIQGG